MAVVVHEETVYLPAEQVVQGVQALAPADTANVPVAHWAHAAEVCMPVPVLKVPARQLVQELIVPVGRQGP